MFCFFCCWVLCWKAIQQPGSRKRSCRLGHVSYSFEVAIQPYEVAAQGIRFSQWVLGRRGWRATRRRWQHSICFLFLFPSAGAFLIFVFIFCVCRFYAGRSLVLVYGVVKKGAELLWRSWWRCAFGALCFYLFFIGWLCELLELGHRSNGNVVEERLTQVSLVKERQVLRSRT